MLISPNQFRMDKNVCQTDTSGISSHRAVKDHTDGNFPCLYMCLRQLEHGPESAYNQAINLLRNVDEGGKARGIKSNAVIILPNGSENSEPTPTPITPKDVMSKERFFKQDQAVRSWAAKKRRGTGFN